MSIEHIVDLSRWINISQLGTFIGYKSHNVKGIEKRRKVLLNIERSLSLKIAGDPKAVDLALVDVELHALSILTSNGNHSFRIPAETVGYLIGKNGSKVNGIKNDSGAKITLGRKQLDSTSTEVTVTGEFSVILSAVGMIKDRLDSFGRDFTPYNRADRKEFFESWDEVVYED